MAGHEDRGSSDDRSFIVDGVKCVPYTEKFVVGNPTYASAQSKRDTAIRNVAMMKLAFEISKEMHEFTSSPYGAVDRVGLNAIFTIFDELCQKLDDVAEEADELGV